MFDLKIGEVFRSTSINRVIGDGKVPGLYMDTWRTKRGYRYVLLLLAVEDEKEPVNPERSLEQIGFVRKRGRQ